MAVLLKVSRNSGVMVTLAVGWENMSTSLLVLEAARTGVTAVML